VAAQQVQSERGAALAEGEARRLRSRIAELEAEAAAARRGGRESREVGTMRARLLLDALLDTAQGLRRELALPPVTIAPADTVNAVVPPAGEPLTADQGRSAADPGLLSELLALPRVHLVVDGYNVTKTAWPETPLATQRTRLLTGLGAIVARCGAELTVVFDGADLRHAPATSAPRGVRVLFSPAGVSADDVIKELVAAEPPGRPLVVASSDREIADAVAASGARAVAALALVGLLQR
jgi:predicted RNA-binding protein with PIN domain